MNVAKRGGGEFRTFLHRVLSLNPPVGDFEVKTYSSIFKKMKQTLVIRLHDVVLS